MILISTKQYDFSKFALISHGNTSPMSVSALHDLLIIRLRTNILGSFELSLIGTTQMIIYYLVLIGTTQLSVTNSN